MNDTPWRSASSLGAMCTSAMTKARALRERIKQPPPGGERTVDNTLELLNQMALALDAPRGWAALMAQVHPDARVREVASERQRQIAELDNAIKQDRGIYEAIAAIDTSRVEAEEARVIERTLRQFRRAGVDQDQATRLELSDTHALMVRLSQLYRRHLREDVRKIEVEPADIAAMPEDFKQAHPPDRWGKVTLTTDAPDFVAIQTYCGDARIRRDLYRASAARGYPDNKPILEQLLQLRRRYAELLGYESWAAYQAEDKMVGSAESIGAFLAEVDAIAAPRAEADLEQLLAAKRADVPDATTFEAWDRLYYERVVRSQRFGFDASEVRPYFPFRGVKAGVLEVYAELFSIRIERVPDAQTWHSRVEAYEIFEPDGEGERLAGRFYLDLHPRRGKFRHAAMFATQTGLAGTDRVPVACLACNFPQPGPGEDQPGLLEHRLVLTFFHELGHLMHHLFAARSRWVELSGLGVEWDFVEVPSQLMEEWAWDPAVLARISGHHQTGAPIPDALVAQMKAADAVGKGTHLMRQVFYATYAYELHARDLEDEALDLEAFTDELFERLNPFPRDAVGGDHLYAYFEHLVGYGALYYTYQWSLVIAKDFAQRFAAAEAGLMDGEVAAALKDEVLAKGAMRPAAELVDAFLGRTFALDAYKAWVAS